MSEIVASSVNGNKNGSSKRKRRSSIDEVDIENQRPPAKKIYSSSGEDLDSASDIENDGVELDLYTIGSCPPPVNLRQNIDGNRSIRTNSASRSTHSTSNNNNDSNKSSFNNNSNQHKDSNCRSVNGQAATLTPINHKEPIQNELTPQSLKKTGESWAKCTRCHSKNDIRICPLPLLSWADAKQVWRFMCDKDRTTSVDRSPKMLSKHQGLQPRMRAILLDWLNEVCEVYKLHRETYYLALDYLDRYLSTNVSISKTFLQLIGITCLFIAAKVEEIYPPKLSEFAYVTDGACSGDDILQQELVILSALKWQTNPITIIGWVGIYMQLQVSNRSPKTSDETPQKIGFRESIILQSAQQQQTSQKPATAASNGIDDGFVFPQFSGMEYAHTAQLIDLCTLDVGIANFPYSVVAAAAISHTFNEFVNFIAAKVEEIYPPKLSEFAYVTDGACSGDDILQQELVILSALKWQTNPITIIGWVGIYMQLQVSNRSPKTSDETPQKIGFRESIILQSAQQQQTSQKPATAASNGIDDGFVFPQFSGMEYAHTAQLIDLCTLDVGIANFPYSVVAAAAISHTFNEKLATKLSGMDWTTIVQCHRWMEPYFQVILQQPKLSLQERNEQVESRQGMNSVCPKINTDDSHIIQMHTTSMDMFDQAQLYREKCLQEASPAPMRANVDHICSPEGLLTPPDSSRKFAETPGSTNK